MFKYKIFLRIRLKKIENCYTEYKEEHFQRIRQSKEELLDTRELAFAESFHMNTATLFEETFLKMLPTGLQAFPVAPQLKTLSKGRVFAEVLKDNVSILFLCFLYFIKNFQ